ncbi:MAG: hypothetical protein KDK70_30110, partial [Myxococcales bacterium]|nr:hypothetical protein [Myxococcales bacterium]
MSLYVVVEGDRTEPRLYRAWLPLLLPGIAEVRRIEDARGRAFFLIAGKGYPHYLDRIEAAIEDIRASQGRFTHLLVCIDAEEAGHDERLAEVEGAIARGRCPVASTVIVAECCVETWLLGNRRFIRPAPHDPELGQFLRHYDVRTLDPEGIAPHPGHRNRASLCLRYVQAAFRERHERYSKKNPGAAA